MWYQYLYIKSIIFFIIVFTCAHSYLTLLLSSELSFNFHWHRKIYQWLHNSACSTLLCTLYKPLNWWVDCVLCVIFVTGSSRWSNWKAIVGISNFGVFFLLRRWLNPQLFLFHTHAHFSRVLDIYATVPTQYGKKSSMVCAREWWNFRGF